MIARIVRVEQTTDGAIGVLLLDGIYFCNTLQPDAADKKRFCIPAGDYLCKRFHGWKWKNTFEIIVKGHTALLFHAGNIEKDSVGCILLGATVDKLGDDRAVLNSGATFQRFLDYTANVNSFTLKIVDCY
mgnify:CR=1 FL=1